MAPAGSRILCAVRLVGDAVGDGTCKNLKSGLVPRRTRQSYARSDLVHYGACLLLPSGYSCWANPHFRFFLPQDFIVNKGERCGLCHRKLPTEEHEIERFPLLVFIKCENRPCGAEYLFCGNTCKACLSGERHDKSFFGCDLGRFQLSCELESFMWQLLMTYALNPYGLNYKSEYYSTGAYPGWNTFYIQLYSCTDIAVDQLIYAAVAIAFALCHGVPRLKNW